MAMLLSADPSTQLYGNSSSDLNITDLTTQLISNDGVSIAGLTNQTTQDSAQISQAAVLASQAGTLQANIQQILDAQANGTHVFSSGNAGSLESQIIGVLGGINGLISSLNTAGQFAQANGLGGQSALTCLAKTLSTQLTRQVDDASLSSFNTAESVGIQQKNGVFSLNVGTFGGALNYSPSQVQTLLTGNTQGTLGLLGALNNTLQNALSPTNGLFVQLARTDTLNISSTNGDITNLQTYGTNYEALLMSGFNVSNQLIINSLLPLNAPSTGQSNGEQATYTPPKNTPNKATSNAPASKAASSSTAGPAQANKL